MISDEELLKLNAQGFIPGPYEKEEDFLQRIALSKKLSQAPREFFNEIEQTPPIDITKKVLRPRWNWTRAQLNNLFDTAPYDIAMFFSDEKFSFFQGAATWVLNPGNNIKIPLLQFRSKLKDGNYLWIYNLDDILAHEAIHAIRIAFEEPKTEEIFAYMTSSSMLRRILGPIIRSSKEVLIFLISLMLTLSLQIIFLFSEVKIFSYLFLTGIFFNLGYVILGLCRLFLTRVKFTLTYLKLKKLTKDKNKARAILFRLTDDEIDRFSRMNTYDIKDYIRREKDVNLRYRLIVAGYL